MRIDDMTPDEREGLRDLILRSFKRMRLGLTIPSLTVYLSANRNSLSTEDLETTLQYLVDKGLLVQTASALSAGNRLWRLTASGIDYLESKGL